MKKKSTQFMDITIFGLCLFAILLLLEYRRELADTIDWWIPAIPLAVVGLMFGFRGANAGKVKTNDRD